MKRPTGPRRDWRYRSACRAATAEETAVLTRGYEGRDQAAWLRSARKLDVKYCQRCPVEKECLAWAVRETGFTGLAAGTVFQFTFGRRKHWKHVRPRRMFRLYREEQDQ